MRENILDLFISIKDTVNVALKRMSDGGERILIVVDSKHQLSGVLSDGNIRRWIINCGGIKGTVKDCYNPKPIFITAPHDSEKAKALMLENKIESLPIVDHEMRVIGIVRWNDVFSDEKPVIQTIDCPAVIMAGGKGTRLDPFTRILPKPLIPINDKAVIEIIMEKLAKYGINQFYISVNHKAKILKAFLEEQDFDFNIDYIQEDKPLGTAGSLRLLKGKVNESLLITNCDIVINSGYADFLEFHKKMDADITVVGAMRHFAIPYGVCEIENGGRLVRITEKPEYDFLVNTGMYFIKPSVLSLIPKDKMFHFTDLIHAVKKSNGKVFVFPVEESSWVDVGQWEEYRRAQKLLRNNL